MLAALFTIRLPGRWRRGTCMADKGSADYSAFRMLAYLLRPGPFPSISKVGLRKNIDIPRSFHSAWFYCSLVLASKDTLRSIDPYTSISSLLNSHVIVLELPFYVYDRGIRQRIVDWTEEWVETGPFEDQIDRERPSQGRAFWHLNRPRAFALVHLVPSSTV